MVSGMWRMVNGTGSRSTAVNLKVELEKNELADFWGQESYKKERKVTIRIWSPSTDTSGNR